MDAFDKSRFIKTFLTILGVTGILCSFKLLLEGKAGKVIPDSARSDFLETFLANDFVLSGAKDNPSGPFNRGGMAESKSFLQVLCQALWAKFLGRDPIFCFISICKFSSFKKLFGMITSLFELYFRFSRFILLVQTK